MSSSTIFPVVPTQMVLQPLTSNSEHVVSKRFRSFLPEVNADSYYNSNNTIRITLNSASEFLSGNESYLEFKLTCTAANGGLQANKLLQRYLDHCGHSLFSSMNVQLSNGTYTNATRTLAALAGQALTELSVGDAISVNGNVSEVQTITDNSTVVLRRALGGDLGAGAIVTITASKQNTIATARQRAAITDSIKIKIKPFSNLLNCTQLLPLMYMKNLQIVLTLERPEFVMSLVPTPNNTISFNYTISDMKYQACLIQPSDEVLEMYRIAFNSESPEELSINIPYVSYQHSMKYLPSPNGLQSFTINSTCRSAVSIISAFYSAYSETISTATNFTHNVDSTSQTLKNGCTSYRYRIGSEIFPSSEGADVSGPFNSQMLSWAQLTLQSHGNALLDVSFKPNEFFAVNPVRVQRAGAAVAPAAGDISNDSIRAIFASHLNRYYSFGCGADLLQNDIIAEFDFNNHRLLDSTRAASFPQDIYNRSWIIHDEILSINRSGITVKY